MESASIVTNETRTGEPPPPGLKIVGWAGLALALVVGAFLRLSYPEDIEYKRDEAWSFDRAKAAGRTEPFPLLGMPASVGIPNPGMSVWAFIGLERLVDPASPVELAQAVQWLNIAALAALVVMVVTVIPKDEREPWLWGAALVAVNPLAVLIHRKIWPPSLLPMVTVLFLLGWRRRDTRWGAALWGLAGMVAGQIHLGGFFFVAGFALFALLDRSRSTRWGAYLGVSALAALPAAPWVMALLQRESVDGASFSKWSLLHCLEGKFWLRWVTGSFGWGIDYTLQKHFTDFLTYPRIGGWPTGLMALAHLALIGLGAAIILPAAIGFARRRWRGGRGIPAATETTWTLRGAWWGYGLLLSLSAFSIHRHYMTILFPLEFVWLATLALGLSSPLGLPRARAALAALVIGQAAITFGMLDYIHQNPILDSEYGVAYRAQREWGIATGEPAVLRSVLTARGLDWSDIK